MQHNPTETRTPSFADRYGPWAVVAGASQGLGRAWSRELAQWGLNLLLIARREAILESAAKEIADSSGVEVRTLCLDLGRNDVAAKLHDATRDIDVGLLVYNAAVASIGLYTDVPIEEKFAVLDVNCRGVVALTSHFAPRLKQRGRGGMMLMSSMSGWQGAPRIATYAASKAFITTLGEGLWYELRPHGVDVHVCVAGAISTPNFLASTPAEKQSAAFPMHPEAVVKAAIANLGRSPSAIVGPINRIAYLLLSRLMPRSWAIRFFGRTSEKLYGDDLPTDGTDDGVDEGVDDAVDHDVVA